METQPSEVPAGELEKKVKPALKKHPLHHKEGEAPPSSAEKDTRKLQWDENAIAEHDMLRGTRQKIEEPNTPFHYDSGAESESSMGSAKSPSQQQKPVRPTINWDNLQEKLTEAANCPSSPSSADGAGSDPERDEEKAREFREHRKKHYNEMDRVRQWRAEHSDSMDGDIDNDGSNDADDDMDSMN